MRTIKIIVFLLLIISGIISCKKTTLNDHNSKSSTLLQGKWKLRNDSAFVAGNFSSTGSNYIGLPTDYYDFRSNGVLYVKTGTYIDTASYTLLPDTKVELRFYTYRGLNFGTDGAIKGPYDITAYGKDSLKLSLSGLTPAGEETEIINLYEVSRENLNSR